MRRHGRLQRPPITAKVKLNIFPLTAPIIKRFVAAKFSQLSTSSAEGQLEWTDSFWNSWEEYAALGLKHEDTASFPLVPTTLPSSWVSLEQCKNGDVLLEGNPHESRGLRTCLQALGLLVVHVDGPQIPRFITSRVR